MARASTDLPRMESQGKARDRVARERMAPSLVPGSEPVRRPAKPMMRQYDLVERVRKYNPNTDENLLNRAYVYAMKAHGEQKRASGDPYFSHPLEVAAILTDHKLDDATIVAALLHDTIEDTETTRAEIDQLFGKDIGHLVEGLTKLKRLDLVSREAKQAENLRKLLLAIAEDVRVLLVKLADRLHNMRTIAHMPAEARRRVAEETIDIYAPLAGRIGMYEMREELESLAFRELNPEAHKVISERLDALAERHVGLIAEIEAQLVRKLANRGIEARVRGRRKRAYSIWRKMERKAVGFEQLSDIFGFRVIVKGVPECYQALGVVHTTWPVVPGRFKDYVSTPKQNDYRSIHTTVIGPGNQRVELQIRTEEMDEIAEYGIAAHVLYKDAAGLADRVAVAGIQRLCVAAPHHRAARRRLQPGRIPRAHQARTVPGPGVLLHPQGQADRAAAQGDDDRFRLCGAHRCRQSGGRLQDQRQDRAAGVGAAERRRGRGAHLQGPAGAAGGVGIPRRHRQGARRDPPRHQAGGPRPICRARPPHRRAHVPARQARLFRRPADRRLAAPRPPLHRRCLCRRRPRRDEGIRRGARHVSRLQGGARRRDRPAQAGARLVRPRDRQGGEVQASGRRRHKGTAIPIRGINSDLPVRFAPDGGAVPGDRIVGIMTPGEGITIYPIQSSALKDFEDTPERWLDVRWDVDGATPQRFPARIAVQSVNEPGSLAQIARVIAEHDGNIDNIRMSRRAPDFTSITIDLEVYDLKHLTAIIAQLRAKPMVAKAERVNG